MVQIAPGKIKFCFLNWKLERELLIPVLINSATSLREKKINIIVKSWGLQKDWWDNQ